MIPSYLIVHCEGEGEAPFMELIGSINHAQLPRYAGWIMPKGVSSAATTTIA